MMKTVLCLFLAFLAGCSSVEIGKKRGDNSVYPPIHEDIFREILRGGLSAPSDFALPASGTEYDLERNMKKYTSPKEGWWVKKAILKKWNWGETMQGRCVYQSIGQYAEAKKKGYKSLHILHIRGNNGGHLAFVANKVVYDPQVGRPLEMSVYLRKFLPPRASFKIW